MSYAKRARRLFVKGLFVMALAVCATASAAVSPAAPKETGSTASQEADLFSQMISLDLRDMDIVDVLKFLSLKGKFNVVISKNIQGRVTLAIKDVTMANALDIILRANNLAYNRVNNIVYVMTAEEYLAMYGRKFNDATDVRIINLKYAKPSYVLAALDSLKSNVGKIVIDEDTGSVVLIDTKENLKKMLEALDQMDRKIETKTYALQYAVAKEVAAGLKQRLDAKTVGSIQSDDRSNQVIISAFPERLKEAEDLIRQLDVPTKAVLIEVRILQIILNPKYDYGIDWSNPFGQAGRGVLRHIGVAQSFPISSTISTVGTMGSVTYGATSPDLLQAEINLLKQVSDSRVIARPRLMVTNNEEANIHIGDTIPYVTSTTTGTGDTATVSEQINFIDVGIKLKVTPTINDDGFVTMKIRPEISSKTGEVTTPQQAKIPQVNTTFVETTAIVKDGYTVIIGGLKQLSNKHTKQGLPGLMDVPIAGNLFKNEAKDFNDTETVLFLTPRIVNLGKDQMREEKVDIHEDKPYADKSAVDSLIAPDDLSAEGNSKPKKVKRTRRRP